MVKFFSFLEYWDSGGEIATPMGGPVSDTVLVLVQAQEREKKEEEVLGQQGFQEEDEDGVITRSSLWCDYK